MLIDNLSAPLSYAIHKCTRSSLLPYVLTVLSFIGRIFSAFLFWLGFLKGGAIVFFVSMIIDSVDGKMSRFLFGKDPELRGLADFLLDMAGLCVLLVGLFSYFVSSGMITQAWYILAVSVLIVIHQASISSKFRLMGIMGLDTQSPLRKEVFPKGTIWQIYNKVMITAKKHRLVFHPTMIESEFLIIVVAPFLGFHEVLFQLSILFLVIDTIIGGVIPAVLLARHENHCTVR